MARISTPVTTNWRRLSNMKCISNSLRLSIVYKRTGKPFFSKRPSRLLTKSYLTSLPSSVDAENARTLSYDGSGRWPPITGLVAHSSCMRFSCHVNNYLMGQSRLLWRVVLNIDE